MSTVWEGDPKDLKEPWVSVENIQLAAAHCPQRELIEDVEIRTCHVLLIAVINQRTHELLRAPNQDGFDTMLPEVIGCYRALRAAHLLEAA